MQSATTYQYVFWHRPGSSPVAVQGRNLRVVECGHIEPVEQRTTAAVVFGLRKIRLQQQRALVARCRLIEPGLLNQGIAEVIPGRSQPALGGRKV